MIALFVGLAVLAGALLALHLRRARGRLPPELKGATLMATEKLFVKRLSDELEISARVDRLYRTIDGRMVLVELKTRPAYRVYQSDVVQLAAQRLAIGEGKVDDVAHVAVEKANGKRRWIRVKLLPASSIIALAARRQTLARSPGLAQHASSDRLCIGCEFKPECWRRR